MSTAAVPCCAMAGIEPTTFAGRDARGATRISTVLATWPTSDHHAAACSCMPRLGDCGPRLASREGSHFFRSRGYLVFDVTGELATSCILIYADGRQSRHRLQQRDSSAISAEHLGVWTVFHRPRSRRMTSSRTDHHGAVVVDFDPEGRRRSASNIHDLPRRQLLEPVYCRIMPTDPIERDLWLYRHDWVSTGRSHSPWPLHEDTVSLAGDSWRFRRPLADAPGSVPGGCR